MKISYIALGSNIDDNRTNILNAINLISQNEQLNILDVAPLYYNAALLQPDAPEEFNKPFCNTVIKIETDLAPHDFLKVLKDIEALMGRQSIAKWSPRVIDLDIIYYEGVLLSNESLTIPHKDIMNRSFVLDPLSYIASDLNIFNKSITKEARSLRTHMPVIMGILNITDDSFSSDGILNDGKTIESKIDQIVAEGIGIIDIGAQSTRPGAKKLSADEEISRLKNVLPIIKKYSEIPGVRFSIDTYHYEVAKIALEHGVKIINDVSNLSDINILNIVKDYNSEIAIMHSLSVPADPNIHIPIDIDPVNVVKYWADEMLDKLSSFDIELSKIILDPGIGFGKTKVQSLKILQNINALNYLPCKIMIGHSRKSFMSIFSNCPANERSLETVAISLELAKNGVDIIRVHNPIEHKRAFLAASHMHGQYV